MEVNIDIGGANISVELFHRFRILFIIPASNQLVLNTVFAVVFITN
jgi:hypothetical protein